LLTRAIFLSLLLLGAPALAEDAFVTSAEPLGRTPSDLPVERVIMKSQPVAIEKAEGRLAEAPTELPKAIDALKAKLGAKGIEVAGAPLVQFNTADEQAYAADVMLPVAALPKESVADLHFGNSPDGQALRIMHKGPLMSIEDTYFEIQTFVEDQGLDIGDTTIERYVTDLAKTAPKDMLTEIYVPLK
jgi:effector-binding domain-containing protein